MSSVVIAGDTSGSVTLQAPAIAGSTVLTLPATSGTIAIGGTTPSFSTLTVTGNTNLATSSGNVGIGTSSPGDKLTVASSGADVKMQVTDGTVIGWPGYISTGSSLFISGTYSNHPYSIYTNNTQRMYVTNSGAIGIGTANPAAYGAQLAVIGSIDAKSIAGQQNTYSITTGGSAFAFGATGLFLVYAQNTGFSIFWYDLVMLSLYGAVNVISQSAYTGGGAAPTRTYGQTNGALNVSISGGTSGTYSGHYIFIS